MKEKLILLTKTDEVQEFVKAASACDFDINLQCERAIVDAKSFLGVLSLGLSHVLIVSYWGVNNGFEQVLNKYKAA